MSKPYKEFEPQWIKETPNPKSYRALMKWGDPACYKTPSEGFYKLIKQKLALTDEDFKEMIDTGEELVDVKLECRLSKKQIDDITAIVGEEWASVDDFERVSVAYGKTMLDVMRLRKSIVENVPDIVCYPSAKEEIEALVAYADKNGIKVYVRAGGSGLTRGSEAMLGPSMMLELGKRFNKVLAFNEVNSTITVQSGISGVELEKVLNEAPEIFGAERRYTCGHFPQSFEHSCVGGWVVTRGSGQNSTYYGCAQDIVLAQEYITPIGTIKTDGMTRKATGPDIDQIMMGSEGCFGILSEVTLKIFHLSQKHRKFSFMFPTWEDAMSASREIMQGEFGKPSVFRISDAEETDVTCRTSGIEGGALELLLDLMGFKKNRRCLAFGFADGEDGYQKNVVKNIKKIAKKYHGLSLTGYVTTAWEKGRFENAYLRDSLQDYGIVIDTFECAVNWDNMPKVYADVQEAVKKWENAICMCHVSHCYPQGASLHFLVIIKTTDVDEYKKYHSSILQAIANSGASLSHHHGIGKLFAPYLEESIGKAQLDVFKALKKHFDKNNTMNPGGTLALDELPNNF